MGDRATAGCGDADGPADERQAQAAVVRRLRAEASSTSRSWRPRWRKPRVAAGRAVLELELDLDDLQPRPGRVDRHTRLHAEAGREREAGRAATAKGTAGPRGAPRLEAGREANERARNALREPEAAALPAGEGGDSEVGVGAGERPQVAAQVGVAEEERPRRRGALGERQRLALAAARQASTRAPAASAAAGSRPVEPSSATTIPPPGRAAAARARSSPIRSASSRAATRTVELIHRKRARAAARSAGGCRPRRCLDAVVAGRPPPSSSTSASRPTGVSIPSTVDSAWRGRPELRLLHRVGSTPTAGSPRLANARVEAGQEPCGRRAAAADRADDEDGVGIVGAHVGALLDEIGRERVQKRVSPARHELAAEVAASWPSFPRRRSRRIRASRCSVCSTASRGGGGRSSNAGERAAASFTTASVSARGESSEPTTTTAIRLPSSRSGTTRDTRSRRTPGPPAGAARGRRSRRRRLELRTELGDLAVRGGRARRRQRSPGRRCRRRRGCRSRARGKPPRARRRGSGGRTPPRSVAKRRATSARAS